MWWLDKGWLPGGLSSQALQSSSSPRLGRPQDEKLVGQEKDRISPSWASQIQFGENKLTETIQQLISITIHLQ